MNDNRDDRVDDTEKDDRLARVGQVFHDQSSEENERARQHAMEGGDPDDVRETGPWAEAAPVPPVAASGSMATLPGAAASMATGIAESDQVANEESGVDPSARRMREADAEEDEQAHGRC